MPSKLLTNFFLFFLIPVASFSNGPDFTLKTPAGHIDLIKTSNYYYGSLMLNQPDSFQLVTAIPVRTVEISPKSHPIVHRLKDNIVHFSLSQPGFHLIRLNDSIRVFVFAESPEKIPEGSNVVNVIHDYQVDATGTINETNKIQRALEEVSGSGKILLFPRGNYLAGQLKIKSNSRIFLESGAMLNADTSSIESYASPDGIKTKRFIYLNGTENVEISGYGTINGNGRILRTKFGDDARMRLILAVHCKNLVLQGLHLLDPGSWNTQILLSEDVLIQNVKLLNNTSLSNTDGFDPDGCKRLTIENCFACCSDDNVAIKTTGAAGQPGNADAITVRGCTFLTKKSALKVGTETLGETMKNIRFEDNEILESDRGMALYVSDGTTLDSILFKNNHFERNFPDLQQKAFHFVVSKRNSNSKLGKIQHVTMENNYFETPFPRKSLVKFEGEGNGIDVTIHNLFIAGKKVETMESAGIQSINSTITFK